MRKAMIAGLALSGILAIAGGASAFEETPILVAQAASAPAVKTYECGLMEGLLPTATALASVPYGRGDVDYWVRQFEVRRQMGNSIAEVLAVIAKNVSVPVLKMQLEEISLDILAAPQTGGWEDVDYWVKMTSDQNRVLKRAGRRIETLKEFVCSGGQVSTQSEE